MRTLPIVLAAIVAASCSGADDPAAPLPPVPPPTPETASVELIYDDDVADVALAPVGAEGLVVPQSVIALRFDPPADGVLTSGRILIGSLGLPTGPLEVLVYANDGGSPGDELLDSPLLVQADRPPALPDAFSVTTLDVDFDDVPVSAEGFFIGVRFVAPSAAETPFVAVDRHRPEAFDRGTLLLPEEGWMPLIDAFSEDGRGLPMIRATVEVPEAAVTPLPVMVSNTPRDCYDYQGGTLPDAFINQWAAARLVPPQTPFRVDSIRYEVRDGPNPGSISDCDATLSHRVWVFVGNESPAETPTPADELTVQLERSDLVGEITPVDLELSTPLVLGEGDVLYVAVEMPGDSPRMCVGICGDDYRLEDNWLSGGLEPPFTWTHIDVLNVEYSVTHRAYGVVEEPP